MERFKEIFIEKITEYSKKQDNSITPEQIEKDMNENIEEINVIFDAFKEWKEEYDSEWREIVEEAKQNV